MTVFEKNKEPGGMVVYGIPSFVMEKNIVQAEIDVLRAMGVEIKCGVEVGKDITMHSFANRAIKRFMLQLDVRAVERLALPEKMLREL